MGARRTIHGCRHESQHRVSWASRGSQIGQKMQTNRVWNRHGGVQDSGADKASSNARVQMSLGRGSRSTVSTAGKSVAWDEGRRLLVCKDREGKLTTIESRQAEVRKRLMAVKPMTQQRQWVCFGPDRAFAYKIETGRVTPFESTPNGLNITVEIEAPNDANNKLQDIMDIMMTEKRLERTEKIKTHDGDRFTSSNKC